MIEVDGKAATAIENLQGTYEDIPGFRAVVNDGSESVIVVDPNSLSDWEKRVAGTDVQVAPSCISEELIAAAKRAVAGFTMTEGDFASAGYDAISDAVVVDSTLSAEQVKDAIAAELSATRDLSEAVIESRAVRVLQADRGTVTRSGRLDDAPDFYGGAKINVSLGGGQFEGCTTGFYLNSGTNGTVMLTAGHCSAGVNGRTVYNGNKTLQLGTTEGVHFPDPDLVVIDGSSYAAYSYSANNQTSFKPISGSNEPGIATSYCEFGFVSLRVCSTYNSLDVQFCDESGCTNHLALTSRTCASGSVGMPGDSGAGVYRELTGGTLSARATVIAVNVPGTCPNRRWDHKLSTILNTFAATVVTAP